MKAKYTKQQMIEFANYIRTVPVSKAYKHYPFPNTERLFTEWTKRNEMSKELGNNEEICTCCNQVIAPMFHQEYAEDGGWDFKHIGFEDDTNVPPVFLGKFVDSEGQKWDLGFQMHNYKRANVSFCIETTAILVYSDEAPCYMSPSFRGLDDAREKIKHLKEINFDYAEPLEEMVNRALAKGVEFPNPNY